jgi:hypothetical protein
MKSDNLHLLSEEELIDIYSMYRFIYKTSNEGAEVRNAAKKMYLVLRILLLKQETQADFIKQVQAKDKRNLMNNIKQPLTFGDHNFDFSTKEELLQKAFQFYGDQFTTDQILDKCNSIWNKVSGSL